jgi:hypothetical protein
MGIRAVALVTDVFHNLARLTAQKLGLPADRIIVFPHPLNSQPDDRIVAVGDDRLPAIKERLGLR